MLLGIYFVAMLLKKSRVPGSKGMQKLPVVIMGGAVVFWTLYCFGFFRGCDLTVVDCLIIALLLESAVQSGLIPSNTNDQELFNASTVAAQIVNEAYEPSFMSAAATVFTEQEMTEHNKNIAFSLLSGIISQVSIASDRLANYYAERSGSDL